MSYLLRIRHVFLVASIGSILSCLFFVGLGVVQLVEAFGLVLTSLDGGEWAHPGITLFEALDSFLIGVLFYVVGIGMVKLFMPELLKDEHLPAWLQINDITQLKVLIWETALVTLMVACVTGLVSRRDPLTWDALVLPAAIAVLALSLFFMRSKVDTRGAGQ